MSGRYPIPAGEHEREIEVRRSRFRATLAPAATVDAAKAFVQGIRVRHPDATHHCWAYVVGPPGSTDRVGLSDDGEPHGTAGRPMLDVLVHGPLGDVVAVVTRWYGGTKLGTGGLARAYAEAVAAALEDLPTAERVAWTSLLVTVDYPHVEPLQRLLPVHEGELLEQRWGTRATFRLRLPAERREAFVRQVTDLTRGASAIEDA